jgi:hypothetical protein
MTASPSKNVTVPVRGWVAGDRVTLADNVTTSSEVTRDGRLASVVEVARRATDCVRDAAIPPRYDVSPPYSAVIVYVPSGNVRWIVATPFVKVDVPITVVPSRNVTSPVGTGPPVTASTVAVDVTASPGTEELGEDVNVIFLGCTGSTRCTNSADSRGR